jgi:hypothetical protein
VKAAAAEDALPLALTRRGLLGSCGLFSRGGNRCRNL